MTFQLLYCFFVIEHGRRRFRHFNVTRHPSAAWVVQQLREAFPEAAPYRYVILDRDSKFNDEVLTFLKATGLNPMRTSVQAPWQNGLAERWVGSCRREILDHVIALNEPHLRRLIRDYVNYHHENRTHDSLEKDTPNRRPVEQKPAANATVSSMPRRGGLHHRYAWREAAWNCNPVLRLIAAVGMRDHVRPCCYSRRGGHLTHSVAGTCPDGWLGECHQKSALGFNHFLNTSKPLPALCNGALCCDWPDRAFVPV